MNFKKYQEEIKNIENPIVYISGKITGLTPEEAKANFDRATREARLIFGEKAIIINPYGLLPGEGKLPYNLYMDVDLAIVRHSHFLYMIKNWKDSPGAVEEHELAELEIKGIVYQADIEFELHKTATMKNADLAQEVLNKIEPADCGECREIDNCLVRPSECIKAVYNAKKGGE